ncbi:autotransporter domain-containing protein [Desulfoluna sp.]|uniref:autotransporter outer membrane beta-barrel domain-containing protein n=1 Tax=Desulfoluna sp. TaxID=2045199 RepID=UPI00261DCED9|nr:autotransporter outer membrane beta-barrel domain-containing protein [Desulfoluna sp.]
MGWFTKYHGFNVVLLGCLWVSGSVTAFAAPAVYYGANPDPSHPAIYSGFGNPLVLSNGESIDAVWSKEAPYTTGVMFKNLEVDAASVTLETGSQIHVIARTVTDELSPKGVHMQGDFAQHVQLSGQSKIKVELQDLLRQGTGVSLLQANSSKPVSVSLDEASSIEASSACALGQDSIAWVQGLEISSKGEVTVALDGASRILSRMESERIDAPLNHPGQRCASFSTGFGVLNSSRVNLTLENGSLIEATAASKEHEAMTMSNAVQLGLGFGPYGVIDDFDLSLSGGSKLKTSATAGGEDSKAYSYGIMGLGRQATIALSEGSSIDVDASGAHVYTGGISSEAGVVQQSQISLGKGSSVAVKSDGANGYSQGIYLLLDETADNVRSTIRLTEGSSIDTLSHFSDGSEFAFSVGIYTDIKEQSASAQSTVSLSDGSSITSVTTAAGAGSSAYSGGVHVAGVRSDISLTGNASIDSTASADVLAFSAGIDVVAVDASISLAQGSTIRAEASARSGKALSYGVYHGKAISIASSDKETEYWFLDCDVDSSKVTLDVDATSSIMADWAVYSDIGTLGVTNSGLLAGRLNVSTLSNRGTGVLQASLGEDNTFGYTGGVGDSFYFQADTADLAGGSTFRVIPTGNLGLTQVGDSARYALLKASNGSWTRDQLTLTSSGEASPLLGLTWDDASDDNQLIVNVSFLSPQQAGLSVNGTEAFKAAFADGRSTFTSSPEAWSPNVSGVSQTGMAQAVVTSYQNIGKRLGAMQGLNSGDAIIGGKGLWYSLAHTDADQGYRNGVSGFDADTMGLSLGFDHDFGAVVLGVAYTQGKTDADVDDHSATYDMNDNLFSLYGNYDGGQWFGEGVLTAGTGNVDSVRYVGGQGIEADYDSRSLNLKVESGMKLFVTDWQLTPLLSMEYAWKKDDAYTESGGDLALHVQSQDHTLFNIGTGVSVQKEFRPSWGAVTPEVKGMVYYDVENDRVISTANFVGGSHSFTACGVEPAETSWQFGAALTLASLESQDVCLRLGYDYSGREDFQAHSVSGKVRFEF